MAVGFVLTSNAVVTYGMIKGGAAVAAVLAAPVCLWQSLFHCGILYIESGSKVRNRHDVPWTRRAARQTAHAAPSFRAAQTYKELHLPLHAGLAALWACLGVGVLTLKR